MTIDDDDERDPVDEQDETGEGQGTEGQDTESGEDESDVSAEHAGEQEDDGEQHEARGQEEVGRGRGGNRFQRLSNDNATLREELAAIRRQREEEARRAATQQQQWDEQSWNDRLAVMTPEERINAMWQRGQYELQQQRQQMSQQLFLMRDQMAFDAKASVNQVYARHQQEVERVFQERLQQGRGLPREEILKQVLGERALASANKVTTKARKQGQRRIEAQTTRPQNTRGDAASTRGRQGDTVERRLAGVEI